MPGAGCPASIWTRPVPDANPDGTGPLLEVQYAVGGGTAGNGGVTVNWLLVRPEGDAETTVASAENVVPAEGGTEPETIAQVRGRIADALTEVTRAVIPADYEELAMTTPGVAVARCYVGPGEHPRYPCSPVPGAVTIRVVPGVPDPVARLTDASYEPALEPDPGALQAVTLRLESARLIGTEVFVRPPRYRPVTLQVAVSGAPGDPAGVRAVIRAALRRYLDPLVGGDRGDGWPFGEPLRPSALLRAAQTALGDLAQAEQVAIGLDGADPSGGCDDIPIGAGWLPALTQTRVATVTATSTGELS